MIHEQKQIYDDICAAENPSLQASAEFATNHFNPTNTITDENSMHWKSIFFDNQRKYEILEGEAGRTDSEQPAEITAGFVPVKSASAFEIQAVEKLTPEYSSPSISRSAENFSFHGFHTFAIQSKKQMSQTEKFTTYPEVITGQHTAELPRMNSMDPVAVVGTHTDPAPGPSNGIAEYKEVKPVEQFNFAECQCGFIESIRSQNSFLDFRIHLESHNRNGKHFCNWRGCSEDFGDYELLDQHYFKHLAINPELAILHCSDCSHFFWSPSSLTWHRKTYHNIKGEKSCNDIHQRWCLHALL
ncbi:unnamed protein product [Gongylonema pulchrum]|uniref:C2H2-type domain-containing protein n=1 Tax=Gongylonema pulchrum TaxID=637853 RepID=A0A183DX70_9BILA|nr:unnamed protein product [Gongylonema pulchrum]